MNLLRDIPPKDDSAEVFNAVIEVISGSRDKYEYNWEWEAFVLDRVLYSPVVFPVEYGFMPQTWFHDNDPLDIMILSYEPLEVGCIVKVRPIGVLIMKDEEGEDPKNLIRSSKRSQIRRIQKPFRCSSPSSERNTRIFRNLQATRTEEMGQIQDLERR